MALTGRVSRRLASDEVNPFWFNAEMVKESFAGRSTGETPAPPAIEIEVFLHDHDDFQRNLFGANNSEQPTRACAGIRLRVEPDTDYGDEIEAYLSEMHPDDAGPSALPVEYYRVDWRTFSNKTLTARPKELTAAVIDSRTIRSNSGMDVHLKQILNNHLDAPEKAKVSLAVRATRDTLASPRLDVVNEKMAELTGRWTTSCERFSRTENPSHTFEPGLGRRRADGVKFGASSWRHCHGLLRRFPHRNLYIGDGRMVHASTYGVSVRVGPISSSSMHNSRRY